MMLSTANDPFYKSDEERTLNGSKFLSEIARNLIFTALNHVA
jgi:hypothetical protein